ncbi:MAG: ATP-binding protein [Succinivibrionaceae bacterium]|nr:ATP-binding protein [Succinivibrionaceae bacterium]
MLIERKSYLDKLMRHKDKDLIKVITGVRRCGKSVLLFDIFYNQLLSDGVSADRIIRVNLENAESRSLRKSDELFAFISAQRKDEGKHYVMIDEIQHVASFEDVLNSLKNSKCDVYVTGSNAQMLSGDISTALRGRSIEIRVRPLSFAEFYAFKGGDVRRVWNEYLKYGGFPYAATENDEEARQEYLNMLESTIANKDIIDRYRLRNPALFHAVYDFLCSNIGSLVSAKKISDTLKSSGYRTVTPDTVGNYLEFLRESFLFSKAYRYDVRGKEYLRTLNKYYITDMGLRNAHLNYRQIEVTHAMENIIYNELVKRGHKVGIGKNQDKEIDFVAIKGGETYYIQSAYSIMDSAKKEQELSSFRKLDDGYKKIVITMDDDPFTVLENGYRKLNLFDFLLNERSLEEI